MLKDFRAFILRGNVLDLAVAVVVGAAFGTVVTTLVTYVITPLISIPGTVDLSKMQVTISGSHIFYGVFLNAVIAFLLIAAAVFFLIVRPVNKLMERYKTEPEVQSPTKQCAECLSNIPAPAKRCAFCAQPQPS